MTSMTYAELVAARAPALLRLAVMLTGDRVEAEDLLQTTLLRTRAAAAFNDLPGKTPIV